MSSPEAARRAPESGFLFCWAGWVPWHADLVAGVSAASVRLPGDVFRIKEADPGIDQVELVGSRARGDALPQSDWDFKITTGAFAEVRQRLPGTTARLHPVVAQRDRLSAAWCYMLILAGPVKVDLTFSEPHAALPAWQVSAGTLPGIDDHFWDWMLWLAAKQQAGNVGLVATELAKLHEHLLATARRPRPAGHDRAGCGQLPGRASGLGTTAALPGAPRRRAGRQPGTAVGGRPVLARPGGEQA
jgi:Nucleotidyltransferase domain